MNSASNKNGSVASPRASGGREMGYVFIIGNLVALAFAAITGGDDSPRSGIAFWPAAMDLNALATFTAIAVGAIKALRKGIMLRTGKDFFTLFTVLALCLVSVGMVGCASTKFVNFYDDSVTEREYDENGAVTKVTVTTTQWDQRAKAGPFVNVDKLKVDSMWKSGGPDGTTITQGANAEGIDASGQVSVATTGIGAAVEALKELAPYLPKPGSIPAGQTTPAPDFVSMILNSLLGRPIR